MNKTMFAVFTNDICRVATDDEMHFGLDSEDVLEIVMDESDNKTLEGLYPDIKKARKTLECYECDTYSKLDGVYFSARIFWIEEVTVDDTGNIIECLGTWNYLSEDLYPRYDD